MKMTTQLSLVALIAGIVPFAVSETLAAISVQRIFAEISANTAIPVEQLLQHTSAAPGISRFNLYVTGIRAMVIAGMLLVAWLAGRRVFRPIETVTRALQHLAVGDLAAAFSQLKPPSVSTHSRNELTVLSAACYHMAVHFQESVAVAENLSRGDMTQTIPLRSEHDLLGRALQNISAYIQRIAAMATAIAQGDVRQEIRPAAEHDVIGAAFQELWATRKTISHIISEAEQLRDASENLKNISTEMAGDAKDSAQKVLVVAESSEQMNRLVRDIATATGELSSSISEISRNSVNVSTIVTTAVKMTNAAAAIILNLETQSREIGEITQVITTITQQTNLLALNATIEAARAGESGRGFAVVAHEVKELAREIAASAGDISQKIAAIQAGIAEGVSAMSSVSKITMQVDGISKEIMFSVGQQTVTTNTISQELGEAAVGTDRLTNAINDVSAVAQNTSDQAVFVLMAADDLGLLADKLQGMVKKFAL